MPSRVPAQCVVQCQSLRLVAHHVRPPAVGTSTARHGGARAGTRCQDHIVEAPSVR